MAQAAGKRLAWFVRAVGFFPFFVGVSFRFVSSRFGPAVTARNGIGVVCVGSGWWVVSTCCAVVCCAVVVLTVLVFDFLMLFAGLCLVLWVVNEEGECWPPRAFKNYY